MTLFLGLLFGSVGMVYLIYGKRQSSPIHFVVGAILIVYPYLFSNLSARAFALLPVDSRAAFPSLHAAVSLLALFYAWRYVRFWFWVLLPFVLGLWVSTIYLRHHYVVDLFAGWLLAPVAAWVAPRLDGWWAGRQRVLGYATARGAEPPRAC